MLTAVAENYKLDRRNTLYPWYLDRYDVAFCNILLSELGAGGQLFEPFVDVLPNNHCTGKWKKMLVKDSGL